VVPEVIGKYPVEGTGAAAEAVPITALQYHVPPEVQVEDASPAHEIEVVGVPLLQHRLPAGEVNVRPTVDKIAQRVARGQPHGRGKLDDGTVRNPDELAHRGRSTEVHSYGLG